MNNFNDLMSIDDLNIEKCRLKTFDKHWPHAYISPKILAKIGFYYVGPHDQVKCHFCKVLVSSWEMGDNEICEHERWSMGLIGKCPLLMREKTKNVPLDPAYELDELLSSIRIKTTNVFGTTLKETPCAYFSRAEQMYSEALAEVTMLHSSITRIKELLQAQGAEFPEMETELKRLETFEQTCKNRQ